MTRNYDVYLVSFLQGGCIMGYELLVPKLQAPYFGGSIYVWASSLVFSMLGLAAGYYVAGSAARTNVLAKARRSLIYAAVLIALLTSVSGTLNGFLLEVPLKAGIVTSSFIHLVPVYFFLGMISPLLIALITTPGGEHVGHAAGNIFACSTIAGICFSLLTGFYLIPEQGLLIVSMFLTACLLIATILLLIKKNEHAA
jgi:hypothetical protein